MNKNVNIPNSLSVLRLLGVPVFVYFALVSKDDVFAILILMFAGATDYLDGKLARAWNQTSAFGALLDPAADRIYILATLFTLYLRDVISIWVLVILLSRDAILTILIFVMKMRKIELFEVTYLGKAATFNLLYAFPLLFLATHDSMAGRIAFAVGWGFALWGIVLYVYTGWLYFHNGVKRIRVSNK
ncbi:MAG: CDP-alcohol phosphatidyltransferase family protein [Candidatus Planktophila sp.]